MSAKRDELIRIYTDFIVANAFDVILQNDVEHATPVFTAWHWQHPEECQRIEAVLEKAVSEQLNFFSDLLKDC